MTERLREMAADKVFASLWRTPEGRLRLARLSAAFLRRYSFRSPYPPILVWEPQGLAEVRAAWDGLAAAPRPGPVGLYVHVPFCPVKCLFCNCMSVTDARPSSHDAYLDCLEEEVRLLRFPAGVPIRTVCIGGGTPTALAPAALKRLFRLLDSAFDLSRCGERMVEVSPFSVSDGCAGVLRDWGVSRATLGVQTASPALLRKMLRPQDAPMVREAFARLRRAGIRHLSVDLLAGLPGDTVPSFRRSLAAAFALKPDSVSVYPFASIETTPYRKAGGSYGAADVTRRERMLAIAYAELAKRYPLDAPPVDRVVDSLQRVDRDYRNGSVLGLGYSARSYAKGRLSYVKENRYDRYVGALRRGRFPDVLGWRMDAGESLRAYAVDRLEMEGRLDLGPLRRCFGKGAPARLNESIRLAEGAGLLGARGDRLEVLRDPRNHERSALIAGKLFYSREVLSRVWRLVARGRA